ncbi:MAG: hypothetical protein HY652_03300 [Acidobacteria bacterium]|nr:hypothetical protein [Acidobacteriota bacterium]
MRNHEKTCARLLGCQFDAGVHGYTQPEPGLPMGVASAAAKLWYDAVMSGYYADYARQWAARP